MRTSTFDVDVAHRRYVQSHDAELEAELLRYHEALAVRLATRFAHRGEAPEDLRQVALLAMLRALRSYDPERGAQFSTYAVPSILGALKRHFRDRAWLVRPPRRIQETYLLVHGLVERLHEELGRSPTVREIAQASGLNPDEVVESLEASGARRAVRLEGRVRPDDESTVASAVSDDRADVTAAEDRFVLAELLRRLPRQERDVIVLSFVSGLTQKEIAARLGISQSMVSRARRIALARLRAWHDDEENAA
jgi:RNA polymerase sigma-B factor